MEERIVLTAVYPLIISNLAIVCIISYRTGSWEIPTTLLTLVLALNFPFIVSLTKLYRHALILTQGYCRMPPFINPARQTCITSRVSNLD